MRDFLALPSGVDDPPDRIVVRYDLDPGGWAGWEAFVDGKPIGCFDSQEAAWEAALDAVEKIDSEKKKP